MQADFVKDGEAFNYTPAGDIAAGEVVVAGRLVGIARQPISAGKSGSLTVTGIFDFDKGGTTFSIGDAVYWDDTGNVATPTVGSNKLLGAAVLVAGAGDVKVRVRLGS
jgi:predicted RecA/RadA family phage recombinase